jgi:hypothetical protein
MLFRVLTPEIRQMIWKLAVTVDRVICGPRAELWHVTVRLQRYAFRKPQSFLQVFLEHASTTSDTLQGLQATLRKLEVDSMPYVSRSDPVYDRSELYIYTFIKDNMAILDQNFEIMRTGWNVSLGVLFFVQ